MTHSPIKPEVRLQGIGVSPGIAWGAVEILGKPLEEPENALIEPSEIESERTRLFAALARTREQIVELQSEISASASDGHAGIFDAHLLLLEDSTVLNEVQRLTETQLKSIDWAYYSVVKRYIDSLRRISDPYLRERAVDIEDVAQRVLKNLRWTEQTGGSKGWKLLPLTSIILAHDLTPSDTVTMDRTRIHGFATEIGSTTSHTAIMARSLSIPAVVALHEIPGDASAGDVALIDGHSGLVILHPTTDTLTHYAALARKESEVLNDLQELIGQETLTRDGRKIVLSANIEFVEELDGVLEQDAEGIGLYRTEFFYLSDKELRSEGNQYQNYRHVAEAVAPNGVIIRTLDIGGDKLCPELFENKPEPNPFLGWRGIRLSLDRVHEFRSQLRAILRASAHGKVRVMFPFIATVEELRGALQHFAVAKDELRDSGIAFDESIEVGAMIEIPSAVLVADHLAKEVDFFSIGTNDLIQYTTAVDRVNDRVASLYQPCHPGVVALIRETVAAAHRHGIWCGVCGEAASDPVMTPIWLGLGVDELSVASSQVLRMRRAISRLDTATCRALTDRLPEFASSGELRSHSRKLAKAAYPELLL